MEDIDLGVVLGLGIVFYRLECSYMVPTPDGCYCRLSSQPGTDSLKISRISRALHTRSLLSSSDRPASVLFPIYHDRILSNDIVIWVWILAGALVCFQKNCRTPRLHRLAM